MRVYLFRYCQLNLNSISYNKYAKPIEGLFCALKKMKTLKHGQNGHQQIVKFWLDMGHGIVNIVCSKLSVIYHCSWKHESTKRHLVENIRCAYHITCCSVTSVKLLNTTTVYLCMYMYLDINVGICIWQSKSDGKLVQKTIMCFYSGNVIGNKIRPILDKTRLKEFYSYLNTKFVQTIGTCKYKHTLLKHISLVSIERTNMPWLPLECIRVTPLW